ncbi:hypothetical protein RC1_4025 [Rhodospirillum centenum SW]|uniref:Uncharacterized protein n=1 Tax=Rhodospirillum centenum (strain ATCC 51521 / SW) TaxID=414684 RepID=B6IYJ2_RHOCS|nr:hypothetical protein RC1_4025 [Rhodospirillum centenum SW]
MQDSGQRPGKGVRIAGREDPPVLPVAHQVRTATDPVGDDDGAASVHGLVDDQPPGFVHRGQHEDIAEIEEGRQFGLVPEAEEMDMGEPGRAVLKGRALLTVPDVEQDRQTVRRQQGRQAPDCLQQVARPLAGLELGGEEDDGPVRRQPEPRPQHLPVRPRGRDPLSEELVVDGIGNRKDPVRSDAVLPVIVAVQAADGEKGRHRPGQQGEEEPFRRLPGRRAGTAEGGRLIPQQNLQAQHPRGSDGADVVGPAIAMDPEHVEPPPQEAPPEAVAPGAQHIHPVGAAEGRQEFVAVSLQQRHVPGDGASEAGIDTAPDGQVALEEDRQVDVRTGGDPPQQGGLILDRMRDDIGKTNRPPGAGPKRGNPLSGRHAASFLQDLSFRIQAVRP